MTREEHLLFCKKCNYRQFDPQRGVVCSLTNANANFEGTCENFRLDEAVKEEVVVENEEIPYEEYIGRLTDTAIHKLRTHQDLSYALVGGFMAAIVSALLWAVVTVVTGYQIGFMAIGVGLLVGYGVKFFGSGIDQKFGFLGAGLAFVGCMVGNLLSQVAFIAQQESLGYFETLTYLNLSIIGVIITETFSPIDLLFYGFAIYEGYKFSFRTITPELLASLNSNDYNGQPSNYKLRFPMVIGSLVVLFFVVMKLSDGVNGAKTYTYESGEIRAEGELKNSKENGQWAFFYETGEKQSIGFFTNGKMDGQWQWYNPDGHLIKTGSYKGGLEDGLWMIYYDNGVFSDSGYYVNGRMHGAWVSRFENGNIQQSGTYDRNYHEGEWVANYETGQVKSIGSMSKGVNVGDWRNYFPNGQLSEELYYEDETVFVKNAWDLDGIPLVVNGNGTYKQFAENGQMLQMGYVENTSKVGKWTSYYEDGKMKEEGEYLDGRYVMINAWDLDNEPMVMDKNGKYTSYYSDGTTMMETGKITDGLKSGMWTSFYPSGKVSQELLFVQGQLHGGQRYYFESGELYVLGEMVDNMREGEWRWYYESGNLSSSARFVNDKKEGKQVMFSESGDKIKEETYKNGELIKEKLI